MIIGILAAIAIPKLRANTKEKAYLASMKSDLRNMATVEEGYFSDTSRSTAAARAKNVSGTTATNTRFAVPSAGVTVTATATGGARAGAPRRTTRRRSAHLRDLHRGGR